MRLEGVGSLLQFLWFYISIWRYWLFKNWLDNVSSEQALQFLYTSMASFEFSLEPLFLMTPIYNPFLKGILAQPFPQKPFSLSSLSLINYSDVFVAYFHFKPRWVSWYLFTLWASPVSIMSLWHIKYTFFFL